MIKMNSKDLTLLSEGQIWGNSSEPQLEVIRKYGTKAAITDLCVLTGGILWKDTDCIDEDRSLTGRTSYFWTRSSDGKKMSARSMYVVIWKASIGLYAMVLFAQFCNLL